MKYQRIRNLREDKDLTQATVAAHLGVNQTAYSKYELGQRSLTPEALIKLADFFNTSIDYLLERTDIKGFYPKKHL